MDGSWWLMLAGESVEGEKERLVWLKGVVSHLGGGRKRGGR